MPLLILPVFCNTLVPGNAASSHRYEVRRLASLARLPGVHPGKTTVCRTRTSMSLGKLPASSVSPPLAPVAFTRPSLTSSRAGLSSECQMPRLPEWTPVRCTRDAREDATRWPYRPLSIHHLSFIALCSLKDN